jgi:hypothetical protein
MSVRSERSTSSFASSVSGVARERSGFLMDGSLRDKERRAHRVTDLEVYTCISSSMFVCALRPLLAR